MNHNLHEWYLDVEIILQDGQLEKRLLGIEKCVETLEKDKNTGNVIAWIVSLVRHGVKFCVSEIRQSQGWRWGTEQ